MILSRRSSNSSQHRQISLWRAATVFKWHILGQTVGWMRLAPRRRNACHPTETFATSQTLHGPILGIWLYFWRT
jgi:hypothetical protein